MQFKNQLMYGGPTASPQIWDGTPIDATLFPSVTIFCITAPAAPRQIMGGPTANTQSARSAYADTGLGKTTGVTSISAVGRYDLNGGELISLGGDLGDGAFYISGGQ